MNREIPIGDDRPTFTVQLWELQEGPYRWSGQVLLPTGKCLAAAEGLLWETVLTMLKAALSLEIPSWEYE